MRELFTTVATGVDTAKDRSAAAAAVRSYNGQLATIATLSAAVARERAGSS